MKASGLADCVSEVFKFICLVLCIPISSASVKRSFSLMGRVKNTLRNTMNQELLTNLLSLTMEKKMLVCLKQSENFYDNVILQFAKKERRIYLMKE